MKSSAISNLPDELRQGFDQIINRFEDVWQQGQRPDIAQFLPEDDCLRLAVLRELVHVDLEYRCKSGETPTTDEYFVRYPELKAAVGFAESLKAVIGRLKPNSESVDTDLSLLTDQGQEHGSGGIPNLPERIGRYRVERVLGKGGFGLVFLAYDEQLERHVAVKVPHAKLVSRLEDAEAYLTEARTVANLDHPHVVPVHDVGSTADFPCFVVSKYIDGEDLAARIKRSRLTVIESVQLVATVAEALHYAHKRGLVHRDIKPGNILIDKNGAAFVVDFGLALREQDLGKGARYAGTPAYMSPEQARGEGHRVDGRSDIFSLSVVLYELLVGRRPFTGETSFELLEAISEHEPKPPRQIDDNIPKELDRICLKALSKRASERYSTANDMADDLRHFLTHFSDSKTSIISPSVTPVVQPPSTLKGPETPTTPISDNKPIRIVPKGLRSFDAHDADFFLELLPGPRDRDGLPDSLRFWKTRIEEPDADNTFSVGLIYGPSGCGKSSLMKAGLLPRLSENAVAVYVEATAEETEARLLNGLRKRCAALPDNLTLKETLAVLRRGQGVPVGRKVVMVLDQFEQWLHANKEEVNTELVQALRQCDGGRLQCIVMVRDDFWMAATRFMRELEVRLLEGQNSAAVDLFDLDHARKVLAAFGRAFGKLPEIGGDTSNDQRDFLNLAVCGLAQEGKVISVRLALFAEMIKGKAWTPATLKQVGGTEGVGVTFLEETFSAANAPPEHRYHQKAARAVLKSLLPESGTDIKGYMRSYGELREASGYGSRPTDFDELLRILDSEIRLITPTDPEGEDGSSTSSMKPGEKYYQLTHDYLVPSLRDWLTRKQKESRRGRSELLLADRAAVWNARPESRQLPSVWQWFSIRWWTQKKNWTPPQRKMMGRAGKYHAMRGVIVVLILTMIGLGSWEGYGRLQGRQLRDRLLESTTADVPVIVKDMIPFRRWVDPLLQDAHAQAEKENDPRKQLHASLALLPVDAGQVEYLYQRLLKSEPREMIVIREALLEHKADLTARLRQTLGAANNDPDQKFRAACALAFVAPDDDRWENLAADVAAMLVMQEPFVIAQWTDALMGAGRWLTSPLADFLVDEKRGLSERGLIGKIYGRFAADKSDAYGRLEQQLTEKAEPNATVEQKVALAKKQASIGVALLVMGQVKKVWPLLKHSPDPTLRSYVIDRIGPVGVDPKFLMARLDEEQDVSVKRAIVLSMGGYGLDRLSPAERQNHLPKLLQLYRDDPDPGIHGAAEWTLRQWGVALPDLPVGESGLSERQLATADLALNDARWIGVRRWYLNGQGQTMVVIPKPAESWMGEGQQRRRSRIDRSFAISSKEVTVEQFLRFHEQHQYLKDCSPTGDCPMNSPSWYDAAAYCNWLSQQEQERIPKDQWCYQPNKEGKYESGMTMAADFLERTGYRLATEAEWEYACRAGSDTGFSFGDADELLGRYFWFIGNSFSKSHPVGSLAPNDLGLFDMHGNLVEWCQDNYDAEKMDQHENTAVKDEDSRIWRGILLPSELTPLHEAVKDEHSRVWRGGSFTYPSAFARSAYRNHLQPTIRDSYIGFRLVRTLRLVPFTSLPPTPPLGGERRHTKTESFEVQPK